jgi:hypothetical protein
MGTRKAREAPKPKVAAPRRPKEMANGQGCMNCRFYDQSASGGRLTHGVCRRRASAGTMGAFLRVNGVDWCGEYETG